MNLTPEQQRAVNSRARVVVVSAGAGSGKTAVLTRRIVERLSDNQNPADIEHFLVVTFTNAAALEMRSRITKSLNEKIRDSLSDSRLTAHLRRQISKMSIAKVQTVHSFCLDLCRKNFSLCSLSPDFTIADEAHLLEMREKAVLQVLDEAYACPPEGFDPLRRTLCEERGDKKLQEQIIDLFDKLQSLPRPEQWLDRQIKYLQSGNEKEHLISLINEALDEILGRGEKISRKVREALAGEYQSLWQAYGPVFDYADGFFAACRTAFADDSLFETLSSFDLPKLSRAPKGADPWAKEYAKTARHDIEDCVKEMQALFKHPFPDKDTCLAEMCLCRLILSFGEAFSAEKRRKNVVDFNDLEHFAVKILSTPEGEPSEVALSLREYLCELMVDEYQDTNEVQDEIYRLIAPQNGTSFFVGDIKQSIYRFRRANPKIFAARCKNAQTEASDSEYIAMDLNFRSRPEVLELCNRIFSATMTEELGDVDYLQPGQALRTCRSFEGNVASEVIFIDTVEANNLSLELGDDRSKGIDIEASEIASRIHRLMPTLTVDTDNGTRPAKYSDFAVLLSSFKSKSAAFKQALENYGIPCRSESDSKNAFESIEASVIISMLRIIVNPRQDIPLMSVLRSPFFSFTAEELAEIRAANPEGDLWDAVSSCAALDPQGKCAAFVRELDYYSDLSRDTSCSALLQHIYARTGAYGIFAALPFPESRKDTLDMLYSAALQCEGSAFKQVSEFVNHLDLMNAAPSMPAASSGDGVTVISIHKSKGLEYPFVFVCDLGKSFNLDDCHSNVMLHHDMGLALKLTDKDKRVRIPTVKQKLIARRIESELKSEELRKLYVALTRARDKLFLVMSSGRSKLEKYLSSVYDSGGLCPDTGWLKAQSSAAKWIIPSLLSCGGIKSLASNYIPSLPEPKEPDCGTLKFEAVCFGAAAPDSDEPTEIPTPADAFFDPADEEKFKLYLELAEQSYKYSRLSHLPSKLTPSGAQRILSGKSHIFGMSGQVYLPSAEDNNGETAAEKGTRVHFYLSQADLSACMSIEGAQAEINRLDSGMYGASPEDAMMLHAFASSSLGKECQNAETSFKEYQFSVLLTPAELKIGDECDEHILLNGSIDMLLLNSDGLTVIDFKTDSVNPGYEAQAAEKHRRQLEIYALAAEKIFLQPVVKKAVFFLKNGVETVI